MATPDIRVHPRDSSRRGEAVVDSVRLFPGTSCARVCCQNKCDSDVKRFIFSKHQVLKTFNYFMHSSKKAGICSNLVKPTGRPAHRRGTQQALASRELSKNL